MTKQASGYSFTQIMLHWIIAALILFQLFVTEGVESAWAGRMGASAEGNPWLHIVAGSAVLILACWRIVLRLRHGAPPHPAGQPAILGMFAGVVHWAFYALLFAVPISGLLGWFGWVIPAAEFHTNAQLAFLPLIGLHVVGALAQQLWFRSNVLQRMFRPA